MSDHRSRYSSAPLQNYKRTPKRNNAPQPPRKVGDWQDETMQQRSFTVLQVLLTIVLPLMFVIALLVRSNTLYIVFSAVSAGSLLLMWLMSAFVPNARMTLSIIHMAMIVVSLFAVWISAPTVEPPTQQQTAIGAATQGGDLQSIFNQDSSASLVDMTVQQQQQQEAQAPAGTTAPGSASMAQQQLDQFMAAWINVDYPRMVELSLPTWVSQQRDPQQSMFQIRANRSPIDYAYTDVSGSDADSTRTISMETTISKSNGEAPRRYAMQVLMIRVNDVWYVDPNSLASSQPIAEAGGVTAVPQVTIVPLVTSNPSMTLYYNTDGGQLYHANDRCPRVHEQYLPLTGSFLFSELGNEPYNKLEPCGTCHAPSRT